MRLRRQIRRVLLVGYAAVVCVLIGGTIYSYWFSYGVQRATQGTWPMTIARIDVSDGGLWLAYAQLGRASHTTYATNPLARRRAATTASVKGANPSTTSDLIVPNRITGVDASIPPPSDPSAQWYWHSRKLSGQPFRKRPPGRRAGTTDWRLAGFSFYRSNGGAGATTAVTAPLAAVVGLALVPGLFLVVRYARRARRGFEVADVSQPVTN